MCANTVLVHVWSMREYEIGQSSSSSFHRGPNSANNTEPRATDHVMTKTFALIIIAAFVFIVVKRITR